MDLSSDRRIDLPGDLIECARSRVAFVLVVPGRSLLEQGTKIVVEDGLTSQVREGEHQVLHRNDQIHELVRPDGVAACQRVIQDRLQRIRVTGFPERPDEA